ncbi:MAG: hypothetical protein C4586_08600 [Anaerolineaceae bacterium]|nr:MAG: hypothetical protein C4586_08600 [Anaerolineaceae bacterium]
MPRKLSEPVMRYANAMQLKLNKNAHKGGWIRYDNRGRRIWAPEDVRFLLNKLKEEHDELIAEVEKYLSNPCMYQGNNLLKEAADNGNISMMLADVCRQLKKV